MSKIFSADFRSGTFIDSVTKTVMTPTAVTLNKTDKGFAALFNGSTSVLNSNVSGIIGTGDRTIEIWFRTKSTGVNSTALITDGQFLVRGSSTNNLLISNNASTGVIDYILTVANSYKLNTWHHLIINRASDGTITPYIDLVNVYDYSLGDHTPVAGTNLIFGILQNNIKHNGDIALVRVYDTLLTEQERNRLYQEFLQSQPTEKPVRGFELVKPTDLSMYKEKLGENVILNGGFDSSDNWLSTGDVDISGGVCKITRRNVGPNSVVYQINNLVVGKKYRCSFDTVDSSGSPVIRLVYGSAGSPDVLYTVKDNAGVDLNNLGRHEYDFIALSHTIGISIPYGAGGGPYISIDNFACQELTGLVAAYNMIPSNGTLVDISGNGNNGTINGAVIQSKEGLFTTDTTSNVLISAGPIITTNTYSVLGRIKINDLMASDGVLFSNGNTTTNEIIDSIGIRGGKLSWNYDTGGTYKAGATTDLPLNSYVDFAFVSDGGRSGVIKLYINGVEDTITSTTFYRSGTGSRLFARSSGTGFLGDCADFRIYNRVLSEQEIKDYHNSFIKPVILEDFSNYSVGETRPKEWQIISGEFEIKEDTEKKYLECTSTGTIAIPSKQAYGTWEFDFNKKGSGIFIGFVKTDTLDGYTNGLSLGIYNDNTIRLLRSGSSGTGFSTKTDYINDYTYYSIKITRELNGLITVYIKGGSFGDDYVLISTTGGTGSNPRIISDYTTSSYFIFSPNSGNKIANIKFYDGVRQ